MIYGKLSMALGKKLPIRILQSAAGFYIGTGAAEDFPAFARESVEYFKTKDQAEKALETGNWTQRFKV